MGEILKETSKAKSITIEYTTNSIDTELDNDLIKFFLEKNYVFESSGYDLEKKTRDLAFEYVEPKEAPTKVA